MEALEPEEYMAEFRALRALAVAEAFDVDFAVPLLPAVLAGVYRTRNFGRFLSRAQRETLAGTRCHCFSPAAQCVCEEAQHFILKCWFRQASDDEFWVAANVLSAYTRECILFSVNKP